MSRRNRAGLTWAVGIAIGWCLALVIGAYVPSWGVALAFPAATLVLGAGTLHVPEDGRVAVALRIALALTIGFVPMTVAATWLQLGEMARSGLDIGDAAVPGSERVGAAVHARAQVVVGAALDELTIRWAVMAALLPFGAWALWKRHRSVID